MASVNGVLSPPPQQAEAETLSPNNEAILLSAKRKRDESIEAQNNVNSVSDSKDIGQMALSIEESQSLVRDLVDVLKAHDIVPSILSQPLPRRESSEPQAKRHKAEDGSEMQSSSSILTLVSSNVYTGLDDVLKDIDIAVSAVKEKLQMPNDVAHDEQSQSELSTKASAFKKRAHELVAREEAFSAASRVNGAAFSSNASLGVKASTEINVGPTNTKTVLTLYGNAPGPKQLFSSFQAEDANGEKSELVQTLRRAPLPAGISTTDIVSIPFNNLVEDSKRNTLGDAFPTPPNVPSLQPPKPSKVANTRSSTVGWYQPAAADPQRRTGTYFTQNITPGVWLDYSNASSPPQSGKKKQRDRAMSLGGAKAPQLDVEPAESEAAKLDAVFRSVYSGFAPTKDDSAAVAPTGVIDRIWWQQVGQRNYERLIENEANIDSVTGTESKARPLVEEDEELKEFEKLAETWESDIVDPTLLPVEARYEKSFEEKSVDEILEGISELLETLSSFQRKRHMSLNPSNRPAGLLSAPDTSTLGTPTKPTDSEQNTYEIIRAQLKMMIQSLPPYAVAKLNGDQLADLNISTKIEVYLDDYRGVLEEDEQGRAKAPATSVTAPRPSTSSLHRGSPSALYGNQYSASRPPAAATHQYYGGGTSTPVRAPPTLPRAPSTGQVPYQAPRPTAPAAYRPQGYGTPSFQQPAPRPVQHQYPQTNGAQYMTPNAQPYMRPAAQGYQGVPQSAPPASMNGRYPSQPTYPHQAQAQGQNGLDYHRFANGSQIPRQNSPPNQMFAQNSQTNHAQAHPAYSGHSTPTPGIAQNRQSYLQNQVSNGSTPQATPAQYSQPRQTTGYSTFMSQEQQQLMLERQRAQLANQQQARHAAQAAQTVINNGSDARSPSTPTPQINGSSAVAAGL
ncbi:hypothetical protein LHYA1_G006872 [Lachnellula hyalina]|uniref:Uncharacterized protein n=1 Tax=Lachnellula hyalina TaxID=1316788 RepID=A0A8H8TY89_9HELO|nr:uncharacterized protein LHYA1_G006872 [Lachnellula hyalina]TVY24667.1 hypothetical protein LHYA1_G006872 [Lachnellula hyalina]